MTTEETLKKILAERGVDVSKIKNEDSLVSLGLDSLDLVEIMLQIEDELKVEFSSEEISSLTTVKSVIDLIENKKA